MDRIAHFSALVAQQPSNELFRFSLAQALLAAGRAIESEPHFQACVASKADWMIPRITLGRILLNQGRKVEAKALLEDALRLAIAQQHETPEMEIRALLADLP